MAQFQKFTMPFETMTIEHLGLKLYSTLPPVLSELVSNAYDADSLRVEVSLPVGSVTPESEVKVRDFGHGMDAGELQDEYLPIGRNRRGKNSADVKSKSGKRTVTGRKGLGKLASLGIATEMEVRSIKGGKAICIRLDYEEMKKWAAKYPGRPYEPSVVPDQTGPTKEADGTEVILRRLNRKQPISEESVRRGLAQRLDMIGTGFEVLVNGTAIGPGDRVTREECVEGYSWSVGDTPAGSTAPPDFRVRGWVGFLSRSSQMGRGVSIFAHKKAVELGSFFEFASTEMQFARAYLVGEVHANFLDEDEDLAATARNSVLWESEKGTALRQWGQKLLRWAFSEWGRLRKQEKSETIIKVAEFDKWLETRQPSEQRVANRMVRLLVDDPNLDPESTKPLLEIVKSSVENVAFRELVDAIESAGSSTATLLQLFDEWRVIEAREHLRLADGRLAAIEQLDSFMRAGALEVQEMQPLFERHPWLIDQTWKEADGQTTYTELLRKNCRESKRLEEKNRRLDILGICASGRLTVVELKRPNKKLSRTDLEQIERYVDWARKNLVGTGPDSPRFLDGLLIVGKLNSAHHDKMVRLAGWNIHVETYEDLLIRAREYYGQVETYLQELAPEYVRARRKKIAAAKKVAASGTAAKAVKVKRSKKKTATKVP